MLPSTFTCTVLSRMHFKLENSLNKVVLSSVMAIEGALKSYAESG